MKRKLKLLKLIVLFLIGTCSVQAQQKNCTCPYNDTIRLENHNRMSESEPRTYRVTVIMSYPDSIGMIYFANGEKYTVLELTDDKIRDGIGRNTQSVVGYVVVGVSDELKKISIEVEERKTTT